MKSLIELALAVAEDGEREESTSKLILEALAQHREESRKAAQAEVVELLRKKDQEKSRVKAEMRAVKGKLKTLVNKLDAIDRCWEHAEKTENFLPLMALFDMVKPQDLSDPSRFNELTAVPKN